MVAKGITAEAVKKHICKFIIVYLGIFIAAIGVSSILVANVGGDPITIFTDGLAYVYGQPYWVMSIISNSTFFVLALIFARHHVFIGTLMHALFMGMNISFIRPILEGWMEKIGHSWWADLLFFAVGLLLLGIGVGIQLSARYGVTGVDALVSKVSEKARTQYRFIRIIFDALFVLIGWLLGGVVGYGSIVSFVLNGPIIQATAKFVNKHFLIKIGLGDERNLFLKDKDKQEQAVQSVGD